MRSYCKITNYTVDKKHGSKTKKTVVLRSESFWGQVFTKQFAVSERLEYRKSTKANFYFLYIMHIMPVFCIPAQGLWITISYLHEMHQTLSSETSVCQTLFLSNKVE